MSQVTEDLKPSLKQRLLAWSVARASGVSEKHTHKRLFAPNSFSIVERHFLKFGVLEPQVVMLLGAHVALPQGVTCLSERRIIDAVKIAAAAHYRLAATISATEMKLNCTTAQDVIINSIFTPSTTPDTWKSVIQNAVNARFPLDASSPLWRVDISGPQEMHGEGYVLPLTEIEANERNVAMNPTFHIFFSFNHCLGDGLAMFSFVRTLFTSRDFVNVLNTPHLDLSGPVCLDPPYLLDNLIEPSFFNVVRRNNYLKFSCG